MARSPSHGTVIARGSAKAAQESPPPFLCTFHSGPVVVATNEKSDGVKLLRNHFCRIVFSTILEVTLGMQAYQDIMRGYPTLSLQQVGTFDSKEEANAAAKGALNSKEFAAVEISESKASGLAIVTGGVHVAFACHCSMV